MPEENDVNAIKAQAVAASLRSLVRAIVEASPGQSVFDPTEVHKSVKAWANHSLHLGTQAARDPLRIEDLGRAPAIAAARLATEEDVRAVLRDVLAEINESDDLARARQSREGTPQKPISQPIVTETGEAIVTETGEAIEVESTEPRNDDPAALRSVLLQVMLENSGQALTIESWSRKMKEWAQRHAGRIRKDANGVLLREDIPLLQKVAVAGAARLEDLALAFTVEDRSPPQWEKSIVDLAGDARRLQEAVAKAHELADQAREILEKKRLQTRPMVVNVGMAIDPGPMLKIVLSPDLSEEQRAVIFETIGDLFELVGGTGGLKIEGKQELPEGVREFAS